jgi:hypothetical protein
MAMQEANSNERPPVERAAYTIEEFCEAHGGFSRAHFFNLRAAGLGPREMCVGRRRLISKEAAEDWRRQREAAAA